MAISERQDYAADCNCFHAFGNPCYTVYRDSDWRQIYMDVKLTIQERLKDLRLEKGWTLEQLEQETGISRSALGSYEKNEYKDISHSAIIKLAETYDVSADYLLGLTENRKMINTPLSELHLNDEMIALLKEKKINARLLCEIAAHEGFQKFMDDIEIYVDRHASVAINFLNVYYENQRQKLLHNARTTNDGFMKAITAASNIDESRYFKVMIHDDIDAIINDIRENHKEDASTASEMKTSDLIAESLEEARALRGNTFQKMARFFLKLIGLDNDRITQERSSNMEDILKASQYGSVPTGQRGKHARTPSDT